MRFTVIGCRKVSRKPESVEVLAANRDEAIGQATRRFPNVEWLDAEGVSQPTHPACVTAPALAGMAQW